MNNNNFFRFFFTVVILLITSCNFNKQERDSQGEKNEMINNTKHVNEKGNKLLVSFIDSSHVPQKLKECSRIATQLRGTFPFYLNKSHNSLKYLSKKGGVLPSGLQKPLVGFTPDLRNDVDNLFESHLGSFKALLPSNGNYFLFLVKNSEGETEKYDYVTYSLEGKIIDQITGRYSKAWGSNYPFDVVHSILMHNLIFEKYSIDFSLKGDSPIYPWDIKNDTIAVEINKQVYKINSTGLFVLQDVKSKKMVLVGNELYGDKDLKYFYDK